MIKLDTSYSLGSIIESNFLGISNDEEPDNVIVTLSKNMVTCFHVRTFCFNVYISVFHFFCLLFRCPVKIKCIVGVVLTNCPLK